MTSKMYFTALFEPYFKISLDKITNSKTRPHGGSAPLAGPATAGETRGQVESEKPGIHVYHRAHGVHRGKPESVNVCGAFAFIR